MATQDDVCRKILIYRGIDSRLITLILLVYFFNYSVSLNVHKHRRRVRDGQAAASFSGFRRYRFTNKASSLVGPVFASFI
ncbi:hypothetical protein BCR39DRAFT_530469 [Naematelia encephala]|uniref:Uncharacterized protein n=1 Tax=Naematelia encephala TaxID=71784 RepID=A0A1Y2B5A7_9TREE|nr:hypothetical protein BCR39DRAFT_530469 [Naematelia encephala]